MQSRAGDAGRAFQAAAIDPAVRDGAAARTPPWARCWRCRRPPHLYAKTSARGPQDGPPDDHAPDAAQARAVALQAAALLGLPGW